MFIGENLNERQVACLQLVSDQVCGAQWCRISKLPELAENMTYRALHDDYGRVPLASVEMWLCELEQEGLVERTMLAVKQQAEAPFVRLTEDGRRCNLISVTE